MTVKRLKVLLWLAVLLNQNGFTQERVWERPPRVFWINFGGGVARSAEFFGVGGYLGASFDSRVGLISLRTSTAVKLTIRPTGGFFDLPVTEITDLGVLYGLCERSTTTIVSGSAGIAIVWTKKESTTDELGTATIGIPFEAESVAIPLPVLGIGLKAYGNINAKNPFVGILVCFYFSKFRELQNPAN